MSTFEQTCDDMIRLSAIMLSLDPEKETAHCMQRQADLYGGMDDMAEHAERKQLESKEWVKKYSKS